MQDRRGYSNFTVNPRLLSLTMYLLHGLEPHKVVLWKETNMEEEYSVKVWFFEIMVRHLYTICLAKVIMKQTGSILLYRTASRIFSSSMSEYGSLLCGLVGYWGFVSGLMGSKMLIRYLWKSLGRSNPVSRLLDWDRGLGMWPFWIEIKFYEFFL